MTLYRLPDRAVGTSTVPLRFTEHALVRLGERAWQVPSSAAAAQRLVRMIEHGRISPLRPKWLHPSSRDADLWLELGDLAFPLHWGQGTLVALTCMARGELCTSVDRSGRAQARREAARLRERTRRHDEKCGTRP